MKELLKLRNKYRFTQNEMAEYVDVSVSYYSKIESGIKNPSYNFILKLKGCFPEFDANIFFATKDHK